MQASGSLETSDIERILTSHGIDQAKNVGNYLIQAGEDIDLALCSIAKRTQMSLLTVQVVGVTFRKTEFIQKLYNASAGDILNFIQQSESENILIVAHNPGIHELARTLVGSGDASLLEKLNLFYSPGTLAVIDCPVQKWADIQPGQNELADLFIPD